MEKDITFTIGLDLGDRASQVYVVDPSGELVSEARIRTTREGITQFFQGLGHSLVAFEVGTHSRWVSELMLELGHEPLVANAHQLKMIYGNHKKTDRTDAENLARLARADPKLLSPIQHRGPAAQRALAHIRSRDALVRSRTLLINSVRGQVKAFGGRLPTCSAESFARKCRSHISPELLPVLSPMVEMVNSITTQLRQLEREMSQLAANAFPETALLMQVPGVGPVTALTFVAVIEDPSRFRITRNVGAYLGLCERRDDSGESSKQLRITKRGDGYLRCLLVNCAHYILGRSKKDSDLQRWGLSLVIRGGKNATKRAVVGMARKLSVLLLSLWKTGADYEPLRHARSRGEVSLDAPVEAAGISSDAVASPRADTVQSKSTKACPTSGSSTQESQTKPKQPERRTSTARSQTKHPPQWGGVAEVTVVT